MWATNSNPNRWYRQLCWLKTKGRGYESNYRRGNGIDVYQRKDCSTKPAVPSNPSFKAGVLKTYLSGNNDKFVKGDIETCFKACMSETRFVCKSFDYVKSSKGCNLSKKAKGDRYVSMGSDGDYTYFERTNFRVIKPVPRPSPVTPVTPIRQIPSNATMMESMFTKDQESDFASASRD